MKMSQDAQATGEWAARCVALTEDLLAMTRTAAGLAVSNGFLRAQAADFPRDLNEVGDALFELGETEGRKAAGADVNSFVDVLEDVERNYEQQIQQLQAERDQLLVERDDWKTQFDLSDANCTDLAAKLAELSREWGDQSAKIMELEQRLAERPVTCPECSASLVPQAVLEEPAEDAAPDEPHGVRKACKTCRTKFIAVPPNRKYCDACKAPKKGEPK